MYATSSASSCISSCTSPCTPSCPHYSAKGINGTKIAQVRCSFRTLEICFSDGRNLFAPLLAFPVLAQATQAQRDNWILEDEGRKLGWPELGKSIDIEEIWGAARVVD
ncbi:MAG: DUF2442 domain-containing protein [Desulfovibrio sp.]|nr:DUF2442 domain-containing protein [Desulfovibrio sp.]